MSALQKLMQARIELQGTKLKKSGQNKFANYSYFELSDFLPTVQSIFHNLKLAGVVSFMSDYAKLTITDTEDNSSIDITSPMSTAEMKGCQMVQNLGAVQTYIRRYLWVTALEIVEHDVLDGGNFGDTEKAEKLPEINVNEILINIAKTNSKEELEKIWNSAKDTCQKAGDSKSYNEIKKVVASTLKKFESQKETEDIPQ